MSLAVNMVGIEKRFGTFFANDNVNFELKSSEIHCLLGENGAGKTTLMHMLYGQLLPDGGEIFIRGEKVNFKSSSDAIMHKIGMVSQHFSLIPSLTVSENIMIRKFPRNKMFLIDKKKMIKETMELTQELGFNIDPEQEVGKLSIGEQQLVEIMKALYQGAEILILDEPTALLTPKENEKLFEIINSMTQKGFSIVIITHKLDEAMKCDRATVMRSSKKVATFDLTQTTSRELTEAMFGEKVIEMKKIEKNLKLEQQVLLEVKGLSNKSTKKTSSAILEDINFTVHTGEIFGIAGIAGNGQTELVEALTGFASIYNGSVSLEGENIHNLPPFEIRSKKMRYIPENRMQRAILGNASLADNIMLGNEGTSPFSSRGKVDFNYLAKVSGGLLKEYNVKASGIHAHAKTLSGGNIQKVILARELMSNPKLIIAHEPLRGLDLMTIEFIRQRLKEEAKKGAAVIYVATDYEEVLYLADRIGVMYNGKFKNLSREDMNMKQLGRLIAGDWEDK